MTVRISSPSRFATLRIVHSLLAFAAVAATGGLVAVLWGLPSASSIAGEPLVQWEKVVEQSEVVRKSRAMSSNVRFTAADIVRSESAALPAPVALPAGLATQRFEGSSKPGRPERASGMSRSLIGLSTAFVPAVTGDLYGSRTPAISRATLAQVEGVVSGLKLYRASVGQPVGSTTAVLVGLEKKN